MADPILPFLKAFQQTDELLRGEGSAELGGVSAGADRIKGGGTNAHLKVREHAKQVAAFGVEGIAEREDLLTIARSDALAEVGDLLDGGESVDGKHVSLGDFLTRERNDLVEDGLGVAHAARGEAGDGRQGVLVGRDTVGLDDAGELGGDDFFRDRMELQALAAGSNGRQNLIRLGRR